MPTKEKAGKQQGLYSLTDTYFCFWYRFVYPNVSELAVGDEEEIYRYQIEPKLSEFVAAAFEHVCIEYLRQLNSEDRLLFNFTKIGRWWEKVTHNADGKKQTASEEFDIVALRAR